VAARGGDGVARPANREPTTRLQVAAGIFVLRTTEGVKAVILPSVGLAGRSHHAPPPGFRLRTSSARAGITLPIPATSSSPLHCPRARPGSGRRATCPGLIEDLEKATTSARRDLQADRAPGHGSYGRQDAVDHGVGVQGQGGPMNRLGGSRRAGTAGLLAQQPHRTGRKLLRAAHQFAYRLSAR
jgi:hypothetical protein